MTSWPVTWWPRTLSAQLVVITAAAVILSNAAVGLWFETTQENLTEASITERLLDRAASTASLLSSIPAREREAVARTMSGETVRLLRIAGARAIAVAGRACSTTGGGQDVLGSAPAIRRSNAQRVEARPHYRSHASHRAQFPALDDVLSSIAGTVADRSADRRNGGAAGDFCRRRVYREACGAAAFAARSVCLGSSTRRPCCARA